MGDTIDKIIDAVIKAEGGIKTTNDQTDHGGRTQFGISETSNPKAWADGKVTEEEAREIYRAKYVDSPGFGKINDNRLQHFLVDWGVISGPIVVVQYLQQFIGVTVDGVLGNKTAAAVNGTPDIGRLLNALVDERIRMIGRIVHKNPSQSKWINGWLSRALEFRV